MTDNETKAAQLANLWQSDPRWKGIERPYTARDVKELLGRAGSRTVVTTEKDAVKLASFRELEGVCRVLGFGVTNPLPPALTELLAASCDGGDS